MRDVLIFSLFLFLNLIVTVVRRARPGGLRSVVAESLLVKHQLRILNRGRKCSQRSSSAPRSDKAATLLFATMTSVQFA